MDMGFVRVGSSGQNSDPLGGHERMGGEWTETRDDRFDLLLQGLKMKHLLRKSTPAAFVLAAFGLAAADVRAEEQVKDDGIRISEAELTAEEKAERESR
jgi:hypothetical protein